MRWLSSFCWVMAATKGLYLWLWKIPTKSSFWKDYRCWWISSPPKPTRIVRCLPRYYHAALPVSSFSQNMTPPCPTASLSLRIFNFWGSIGRLVERRRCWRWWQNMKMKKSCGVSTRVGRSCRGWRDEAETLILWWFLLIIIICNPYK